jgi:3-hydroxybutyryl-CoA dehydrogenase
MSETRIRRAAVIGTGMMGPGIASRLACGGVETTLVSRTEESARKGLETAWGFLDQLEDHGLIEESTAGLAEEILHCTCSMADALRGADLVLESVPEKLELKQRLFAECEGMTSAETLLASNTSGLSITAIAAQCARPERVITTHFWNPPHLMPLVEIVRGERTSPQAAPLLQELLRTCGFVPVLVNKDRPGQLGNRLQMALVREAVHIVAEGIADAEAVDTAAKLGFGLRLPVYGILEHQDMVGLELGFAVCDYVARDLNNQPAAPALYRQKIERGETGAKAGRGFHDWTEHQPEKVIERRNRFLLDLLQRGLLKDYLR